MQQSRPTSLPRQPDIAAPFERSLQLYDRIRSVLIERRRKRPDLAAEATKGDKRRRRSDKMAMMGA